MRVVSLNNALRNTIYVYGIWFIFCNATFSENTKASLTLRCVLKKKEFEEGRPMPLVIGGFFLLRLMGIIYVYIPTSAKDVSH